MRRDSQDVFEPDIASGFHKAAALGWSVRGLIDTFEPMLSELRRQRLDEVVRGRLQSVTLLMDAPHDPHNGAAIVRTCDALGVQVIHVIPREEPFLASRVVTKGSEQWVDVVSHASATAALEQLRSASFMMVGSHPSGAMTPADLPKIPRLAIVLGNEHDGICQELQQGVEANVRIPMRGFVESLNVSVSAAVLLSRATEQRAGDLSASSRLALYARWLLQSVARSDEIVEALPPR